MQIIVFSDTHGNLSSMEEVLEKYPTSPFIFLGDCVKDISKIKRYYSNDIICCVGGNNDFLPVNTAYEHIQTLCGNRILCVHGHRHGVKSGYGTLYNYAKKKACDIALFGHTHIPYLETKEGITLLNPGSSGYGSSYALIEFTENKVSFKLMNT